MDRRKGINASKFFQGSDVAFDKLTSNKYHEPASKAPSENEVQVSGFETNPLPEKPMETARP